MDENTIEETPKERDINQLLDLPYSDLTDEEIERVIEFKAAIKARDAEYQKRMEEQRQASEAIIKENERIAAIAKSQLDEMKELAYQRFKDAS